MRRVPLRCAGPTAGTAPPSNSWSKVACGHDRHRGSCAGCPSVLAGRPLPGGRVGRGAHHRHPGAGPWAARPDACRPRAGLHTAAFISGYQGSPLGGYDRELQSQPGAARRAARSCTGPALNEELGATAVMGSQLAPNFPARRYDGVVGIWYGKSPGVDRAGDAIRHAQFAGTARHGGVLALVGDDPACKSSTLPSRSEPDPGRPRPAGALPRHHAGRPRPRPSRHRAVPGLRAVGRRSRSSPPSPTAPAPRSSIPIASSRWCR